MNFDEFATKYASGPNWQRSTDYADDARVNRAMSSAEIDAMLADRAPVDWDRIPVGAPVFVRWHGGNRGLYERREDGVYADDYWVAGGPGVMDLIWSAQPDDRTGADDDPGAYNAAAALEASRG